MVASVWKVVISVTSSPLYAQHSYDVSGCSPSTQAENVPPSTVNASPLTSIHSAAPDARYRKPFVRSATPEALSHTTAVHGSTDTISTTVSVCSIWIFHTSLMS